MSSFYFRVPHYVASYIRNRDPHNRVAAGEVLPKGCIENVMHLIANGLFFNKDERLLHNGSFCERQWNRMLRGRAIFATGSGLPLLTPKKGTFVLDDDEIKVLTGIDYAQSSGDGEYLRFPMPEEVRMPDGIHRTNKNYQLCNSAARSLRSHLIADFRRALFDFMEREKDQVQLEKLPRTVTESLERFMACYDIRNDINNQERNALKRSYYRWRSDKELDPDNYVDHASNSKYKE